MNPRNLTGLLSVLLLLAAACGQTAAQTQSSGAAPTAQPTAAIDAATPAAPTATVPSATATPAAPAAAQPSPSAASAVAPAASGTVDLKIVPADSEARFEAREVLAGAAIQTDAIGRTKDVSGSILLGPDGQFPPGSKIVVNLSTLQSDNGVRDAFIKRSTLQTDRYRNAEFVPDSARGLPTPLPPSGQANFTLDGDLTVHGVAQPVTWDVTSACTPTDVTGSASTVVQLAMFGMPTPRVPRVASIADDIRLVLDFRATRGM